MDSEVDHYIILGLPSGVEGAKLTDKKIAKGYQLKALELHPDKRPDDPNANENFQKLESSYEVLKDEKTRKSFDDLLKSKREKVLRQSQQDSKRRKMTTDLEERERSGFSPAVGGRHQNEDKDKTVTRICAMHANKGTHPASYLGKDIMKGKKESTTGRPSGLDRERDGPKVSNLDPAYEESVIEKMRRAHEKHSLGTQSEESMGLTEVN